MAYVIVVYDVSVERVNKVCQFLKRYLNWVQNSAFEGELTESQIEAIKIGLAELIEKNSDSILIYIFSNRKVVQKEIIGIEKNYTDVLI
jgi:CRISPR-associated protein Cas2